MTVPSLLSSHFRVKLTLFFMLVTALADSRSGTFKCLARVHLPAMSSWACCAILQVFTPLMAASEHGHVDIVQHLLDAGHDVNAQACGHGAAPNPTQASSCFLLGRPRGRQVHVDIAVDSCSMVAVIGVL